MKVLIVEDDIVKENNVIELLEKYGITDYTVETCVVAAMKRIFSVSFDLLITDLGLPRFIESPVVKDEREGLKMMYDLAYSKIEIPTIIYSTTELFENQIQRLGDLNYPFLGQVKTYEQLDNLLSKEIVKSKIKT